MEWIESIAQGRDEWFVVFCIVILALGILRQNEAVRLSLFFRGFLNPSLLSQQVRQDKTYHRLTIPLLVLVLLILGLFAQQFLYHFEWMAPTGFWSNFISIVGLITLVTAGRFIMYWVLNQVLMAKSVYRLHQVQWLQHNFMLALLLLPFSIVIAYGPNVFDLPLLIVGASLAGITFAMRVARQYVLVQSELAAPWMYNVLYLCALEILPPLIVVSSLWKTAAG